MMMQPGRTPAQKEDMMKIRKLADAAIVAALLLTSIPDLDADLTPADLLTPAAMTAAAPTDAADAPDNPASRELC